MAEYRYRHASACEMYEQSLSGVLAGDAPDFKSGEDVTSIV
jgi:hypothetical protein